MDNKIKNLTHSALIAALYVVLTHLQNMIFPESTSFAIQFRVSEAMCVLAFFTPAAIWGLTAGCFLYNLTFVAALPTDIIVGSLATFFATAGMYLCRGVRLKNYPLLGMFFPALCNGLLVGWELSVYIGGGFWINAGCVALGELAVLLSAGSVLYATLLRHRRSLFGEH